MKKAIFILVVCAVPGVLCAQRRLLDVKIPDEPTVATGTLKAAPAAEEKIIVIEPAAEKPAPAMEKPPVKTRKTDAPQGAAVMTMKPGTVQASMPESAVPQGNKGFKAAKWHKVVKGDTLWDLAIRY